MIVSDQKEANSQPPYWLYIAKVVACVIFLVVSCIHLWRIVILIVKIESTMVNSIDELVYFLIVCTYINMMLFYVNLIMCDD